eukprot:scaffold133306_cov98-Phaeocystis_antarctica.AAC.2
MTLTPSVADAVAVVPSSSANRKRGVHQGPAHAPAHRGDAARAEQGQPPVQAGGQGGNLALLHVLLRPLQALRVVPARDDESHQRRPVRRPLLPAVA